MRVVREVIIVPVVEPLNVGHFFPVVVHMVRLVENVIAWSVVERVGRETGRT